MSRLSHKKIKKFTQNQGEGTTYYMIFERKKKHIRTILLKKGEDWTFETYIKANCANFMINRRSTSEYYIFLRNNLMT